MATAETVNLGEAHKPNQESFKAFNEIEGELKKTLEHLRHKTNKHEPAYFAAVNNLSDAQLTDFSSDDLVLVRVATSAYGLHLFGKVRLPQSPKDVYFHFRAFVAGETVKLHSIQLEEKDLPDSSKQFRAVFSQTDPLIWFDA